MTIEKQEMIQARTLTKSYQLGKTTVTALKDISLTVRSHEFMAIAGPSGSGKSTLLNILGCLEKASSGSLRISDQDVTGLSADASAHLRAHKIGFVFQTFNLLPVLTVFENVEFPLHLSGVPAALRRDKVLQLLRDVQLESFAHHRPAQLSGGQRQRVAIARALVGDPALLLADEPTANLDQKMGQEILALLKDLHRRHDVTMVFSTHDAKIIALAERVVELRDGQIVRDSSCS